MISHNQIQTAIVGDGYHTQLNSIPAIKLVQNTLTAEEISPNAIKFNELAMGL